MLFTKASEYALIAMIYIANKNSPTDVDTICDHLQLPKSFLAKILQGLAKEGLLHSFKGAKGGFYLAKDASLYTIKEIVNTAEKKSANVFECSDGNCPLKKEANCKIMPLLVRLQDKVDDFLSSITLAELSHG